MYSASDEAIIKAVADIKAFLDSLGMKILVQQAEQSSLPTGFESIQAEFQTAIDTPLHPSLINRVDDFSRPMCYIYTSGTTGNF